MQVGQSQGMQTMDMSLERLVDKGTISAEVAMEKASDKETFQKLMTTKKGVKPAETH
jgi:twitching motility protein PilT